MLLISVPFGVVLAGVPMKKNTYYLASHISLFLFVLCGVYAGILMGSEMWRDGIVFASAAIVMMCADMLFEEIREMRFGF